MAAAVTPQTTPDAGVGVLLLEALHREGYALQVVAGDGAYDQRPFYKAAVTAGCTEVLVPPWRGAGVWDTTGRQATPGAALRNAHWAATIAPTEDPHRPARRLETRGRLPRAQSH